MTQRMVQPMAVPKLVPTLRLRNAGGLWDGGRRIDRIL